MYAYLESAVLTQSFIINFLLNFRFIIIKSMFHNMSRYFVTMILVAKECWVLPASDNTQHSDSEDQIWTGMFGFLIINLHLGFYVLHTIKRQDHEHALLFSSLVSRKAQLCLQTKLGTCCIYSISFANILSVFFPPKQKIEQNFIKFH